MSNAGTLEITSFRSRSSSSEVQALIIFFPTQLSDKPYCGKIITHAMTVIASSVAPNQGHCARSAASLLASWRNFLNFSRSKRSSFAIISLNGSFAFRLSRARLSPPPEHAPGACNAGQDHARQNDDYGDLEPNEAANFPEDEFNSRAPWRGNAIADNFHASLYPTLKPRKQFGSLVEGGRDNEPRQHHC